MSQQTDFVDDIVPDEMPAKDVDGIPYCRKHHCRMKIASGGRKGSRTAYYRCPVDGCTETEKRLKDVREAVVPAEPLKCSRCGTICERDESVVSAQYVMMKCPSCGWVSGPLPRPEFAEATLRQRQVSPVQSVNLR